MPVCFAPTPLLSSIMDQLALSNPHLQTLDVIFRILKYMRCIQCNKYNCKFVKTVISRINN